MDYLFENLGDERFQEFCHCLINNEFTNSQAFPVGQPDGGRDSISYSFKSLKKEFIVYQVKFVRNPKTVKDIHKWLVDVIEKEKEKIQNLIPRGATGYYLITNVKGTSHLDFGSIDKMNKLLEEIIKIPSMCWWRDDLSRKFESKINLMWSFPELLNGKDILNSILFNQINENKERRESVIKAYLADQYEIDNEVKFKQIELQNKLFELYIDVPLKLKKFHEKDKKIQPLISMLNDQKTQTISELVFFLEEPTIGAAKFLLNSKVQDSIERILLEGGPGQGKSTISQFVCQIHRIRLLNKNEDIEQISKDLLNVSLRIPFKIDLRDIASWVEKNNPYSGILSDEYFKNKWQKSLESFLIAHICYHSKLEQFNSNDLISIFKLSSVLLVFDGFDEIASINLREEIIDFINKGLNRLKENSKSIQVIITSRPAAFSSSIGFSIELYPHFELTDINKPLIKEYVEKWINSRKLRHREASDIRKLVEEKLEMSHLKDLAKNPMQLAILISLLNTRGESLPNKRTALYDSYIELFFNRESEKNLIIRDKRDLIINIHQYLAWILHSETELNNSSGRIEITYLREKLKDYLISEGHNTEIADNLFTVMKERVCALVSRVQGTFEFEVQPLREYFCAKYLYNTAQFSPAGFEKSGTKPERFEELAKNFYWQNVVRFFAGCFDRGELPMLIQKLYELQEDSFLKYTNYPRIITAQLLADWVFTQYPKLLKKVIRIIIEGINIGNILNQDLRSSNSEPIMLPEECGRYELVEECFNELLKFPPKDYSSELVGLLISNPLNLEIYWKDKLTQIGNEINLTTWLDFALRLRILKKIDEDCLLGLLKIDTEQYWPRIQILVKGKMFDLFKNNFKLKNDLIDGIFENKIKYYSSNHEYTILDILMSVINVKKLYFVINTDDSNLTLRDWLSKRQYDLIENIDQLPTNEIEIIDDLDFRLNQYYNSLNDVLNSDIEYWKKSLNPWEILIENGRSSFGDKWLFKIFAVCAAGIKSKEEKCEQFDNLFLETDSLCRRVRYARLKSGQVTYWRNQIKNNDQLEFILLIFLTWGSQKAIIDLLIQINQSLNSLSSESIKRLIFSFKIISSINPFSGAEQLRIIFYIKNKPISNIFKFLLSLRFPEEKRQKFIFENIKSNSDEIPDILNLKLEYLVDEFLNNPNKLIPLNEIKSIYLNVKDFKYKDLFYYNEIYSNSEVLPIKAAKIIMQDCRSYPRFLGSLAEKSCRMNASKNLKPIGQIAIDEQWFKEE